MQWRVSESFRQSLLPPPVPYDSRDAAAVVTAPAVSYCRPGDAFARVHSDPCLRL